MSLYRQTGGFSVRVLVVALACGVVVGAVVGLIAGRASVENRSAADAVADARAKLRPVAAGLELVPIEYDGAVRDGRIVARTEYRAAQGAAARAAAELRGSAADMRAIDPAGYVAALSAVARLGTAVDEVAPLPRVDALATRASARVDVLAGSSE